MVSHRQGSASQELWLRLVQKSRIQPIIVAHANSHTSPQCNGGGHLCSTTKRTLGEPEFYVSNTSSGGGGTAAEKLGRDMLFDCTAVLREHVADHAGYACGNTKKHGLPRNA